MGKSKACRRALVLARMLHWVPIHILYLFYVMLHGVTTVHLWPFHFIRTGPRMTGERPGLSAANKLPVTDNSLDLVNKKQKQ